MRGERRPECRRHMSLCMAAAALWRSWPPICADPLQANGTKRVRPKRPQPDEPGRCFRRYDGKALLRPRMKDARLGEPVSGHLHYPRPRRGVLLAATPQRAPPQVSDVVAERPQASAVRRHAMVGEVAGNHLLQPTPLDGDRLMHAPPQRLLDHPERRPHAVPPALPLELESAPAGSPADVGEAQEVEGLRFAEPAPSALGR